MKKKRKETPRSVMLDWKVIFGILIFAAILILILTGRATPSKINILGVELEFARPTDTPIQVTPVMTTPSLVNSAFPSNTPMIEDTIATVTTVILTPSPTPGIEDQLVNVVDKYFSCINEAKHGSEIDLKKCWDLLSEEYQTFWNNANSGYGLASFISFWNNTKLGYALFYCPKINGDFVDAEFYRYNWSDLSTPASPDIKRFVEFSFALDKNGWKIKSGNVSLKKLSPDCEENPRIEKWTPTP